MYERSPPASSPWPWTPARAVVFVLGAPAAAAALLGLGLAVCTVAGERPAARDARLPRRVLGRVPRRRPLPLRPVRAADRDRARALRRPRPGRAPGPAARAAAGHRRRGGRDRLLGAARGVGGRADGARLPPRGVGVAARERSAAGGGGRGRAARVPAAARGPALAAARPLAGAAAQVAPGRGGGERRLRPPRPFPAAATPRCYAALASGHAGYRLARAEPRIGNASVPGPGARCAETRRGASIPTSTRSARPSSSMCASALRADRSADPGRGILMVCCPTSRRAAAYGCRPEEDLDEAWRGGRGRCGAALLLLASAAPAAGPPAPGPRTACS